MSTEAARAHIEAQSQLQTQTAVAVAAAWWALPSYNEDNLAQWLALVLPIVAAAQRLSVGLVDAFIASVLGRRPLGVDPSPLVGAGARRGVAPEVMYRRPFVRVWSRLGEPTGRSDDGFTWPPDWYPAGAPGNGTPMPTALVSPDENLRWVDAVLDGLEQAILAARPTSSWRCARP